MLLTLALSPSVFEALVSSRLARLLLAASLVAAAPLEAQTSITMVDGGTIQAFGYLVGPYSGTMGSGSSSQSLFLYCVDFAHHVTPGETWDANLSNLGTGVGVGTNTRSADLTLYRQAAWLTTQYALHPEATADIQATIWNLFLVATGAQASSDYWLVQAQTNYGALDYSNFLVATDVNMGLSTSAQEFIVVTPEPATLALLATGMLLVFGVAGRRMQRREEL
jgi:hypothetical protein